jgi:hypothetical protein
MIGACRDRAARAVKGGADMTNDAYERLLLFQATGDPEPDSLTSDDGLDEVVVEAVSLMSCLRSASTKMADAAIWSGRAANRMGTGGRQSGPGQIPPPE